MSRELAFRFVALEIALAAMAGLCPPAQRLRLATAALAPDLDDAARTAARIFLATVAGGDAKSAGAALLDYVQRSLPEPLPPQYDWQRRKDLA